VDSPTPAPQAPALADAPHRICRCRRGERPALGNLCTPTRDIVHESAQLYGRGLLGRKMISARTPCLGRAG
jgi:hypothetical protein